MIAVGVDTHKDRHYAVALDQLGQLLGELIVRSDRRRLRASCSAGPSSSGRAESSCSAIEGAGSWGAGLCQHLSTPAHASSRSSALADATAAPASPTASTRSRRPSACSPARASRRHGARGILDRAPGAADRPALRASPSAPGCSTSSKRCNATAPIALRERIGDGTGKQLERRILVDARTPRRRRRRDAPCSRVMRDLAARSRTLAADATRYEHELAELVRSLDHDAARRARHRARSPPPSCSPATPPASSTKPPSRAATAPRRSRPPRARRSATASTAAATAKPTTRSTRSRSSAPSTNPRPAPTSTADPRRQDQARSHPRAQTPLSRELYNRLTEVPLTS